MDAHEINAGDEKSVFITTMARELHRAGIATDALEQTLTSIAQSIDLPVQIFALPTNITLAVGPPFAQKIFMLRIAPARVNLRKIALLNEIYDELRTGKIDFHQASRLLDEIDHRWPGRPVWLRIPALAMVGLGVAVLLGGGAHEMLVAALIGAATGSIASLGARIPIIARLFEVIAAFIGTLIFAGISHFVGATNAYIAIVAGVVVLLPGYSLTLALHELANQELVAGVARLGRVLSVLLALGCGALLGFTIVGPALLHAGNVSPHPVGPLYWTIAVVLMSIGLSIDLDARIGDFIWVFAASFVAILASHVVGALPVHAVNAFISAFVCSIVANIGARLLRVPQPVMLVPAVLVLVPGSLSYQSILFAFGHDITAALPLAANAVVNAILLVAGLLLSQILFPSAPLRTEPEP